MQRKNLIRGGYVFGFILSAIVFAQNFDYSYGTGLLTPLFSDTMYNEWQASTSTANHYALVDKPNCGDSSEYLFTTTTDAAEYFSVTTTSLPLGAIITDATIRHCISNHEFGSTSSTVSLGYGTSSQIIGATDYLVNDFTQPTSFTSTTFSGLIMYVSPTSTIGIGAQLKSGNMGARIYKFESYFTYDELRQPTELSSYSIDSTNNAVSWLDNTQAEQNYVVERSTNSPFGSWSTVATLAQNSTSTAISGSTYTVYCYRVAAKNWVMTDHFSDVVCQSNAESKPLGGINLTATSTPGNFVELQWTDYSAWEEGVIIERSSDGYSYVQIADLVFNSTKFADYNVSSGNTYYYRVRQYNDMGQGNADTESVNF